MSYQGLLFPADSYHNIGPFRFPVYHDLYPNESRPMRTFEKEQAKASLDVMKLAKKIAKDKQITPKAAFEALRGDGDQQELIFEYAEEVQELQNDTPEEVDKIAAFVTILMQTRGEVKLTPEADYIRTPDWQASDTEQIPLKMQKEINEFIEWERSGWPKTDSEGNDSEGSTTQKVKPSTSTKQS
jgi:hypothetical protein